MNLSTVSKFAAGVFLAVGVALGGAAHAAPTGTAAPTMMVPDFSAIVEKADPAVVNIRTTATVPVRSGPQDPYDLFRFFFGPDFQPPGMPELPGRPRDRQPQPQQPQERTVPRGVGSGFFISADGYILTNNHVVSDATDIFVTLTDGREFKAKVIGTDERTDIALLKIDAKDMPFLPIGDDSKIKKGQWVLAIGSPFGLDSTVTAGIVSAINRDTGDYLPFIQTDVAVNPGNSGGPLLNLSGEVIGINSQIVSRSGGFMGISLAIPIDEVMRVVEELRATGKVTRGRIGVQIGEVTNEVATALGLSRAEGALVSSVEADSPADAAGVQPGDVILRFNNKPIARWSDLPRMVGETKPGTVAPLQVWRKGRNVTLSVKVAELPQPKAPATEKSPPQKEPASSSALGLTVVPVPTATQSKLKIKGGVMVRSADGQAAQAGIQEGDIVLALGDTDITGPDQYVQAAGKADKSKPIPLLVRRGDQTQWVVIQPGK
ncbi:DegQ family serine endoprotease [Bordetella genomosp. 9]|uniref:Probable periplasmic serine endoprotease DegP-like n=1 Tax=Bordetella genomosp. 9 TaxID=1416803 RepID=A0A1W6Z1U3_9BORD|nr:DegQ family serine endoprotease [Bordetella genomosp. 9]ARP87337.1 serine peptidase [Bordetella genomosp. 9]ARP91321.1 serine peptidase [Bordetella genomosp. 9]